MPLRLRAAPTPSSENTVSRVVIVSAI